MMSEIKNIVSKFILFICDFLGSYWRLKNHKKPKIFVYTDSRGFEISKFWNRRNPFSSYVGDLIKTMNCRFYICPEKHTTIFDFLNVFEASTENYQNVVLHCGVVDFSPRPIDQINDIYRLKKEKIVSQFDLKFYQDLIGDKGYETEYMGKRTKSILPAACVSRVFEKLNGIQGLIWISCHAVDLNWWGNYGKARPLNINVVNEFSKIAIRELYNDQAKVIDLTHWSLTEVRRFSCDNIHLSKEGMNYVSNRLKRTINI